MCCLSRVVGFSLYKLAATTGCKYLGRNPLDDPAWGEDCEHVAFHKCMIANHGAKVRIFKESLSRF